MKKLRKIDGNSYPEPTEQRRRLMSRVKSRNTSPELKVRRLLHAMGYRFRLHKRDLPGTPDIVLGPLKKAIFVHGCFWHRHDGCRRTTTPTTRREFWVSKFQANVSRDERKIQELRDAGWDVMVVWECESEAPTLARDLTRFLRHSVPKPRRRVERG